MASSEVVELRARVEAMAEEVEVLHTTLEAKGSNSRRVKALNGSTFGTPVDKARAVTASLAHAAPPVARVDYAHR